MAIRLAAGVLLAAALVGHSMPLAAQQRASADSLAVIRDQLVAQYAAWSAARLHEDVAAADRMLAPEFEVRVGARRILRADFLAQVSGTSGRNTGSAPAPRTLRFDSQVLTLTEGAEGFVAVIAEKIESEFTPPGGRPIHAYTLIVTRDGWRRNGGIL